MPVTVKGLLSVKPLLLLRVSDDKVVPPAGPLKVCAEAPSKVVVPPLSVTVPLLVKLPYMFKALPLLSVNEELALMVRLLTAAVVVELITGLLVTFGMVTVLRLVGT